jgi:hypothetical protein
MLRPVDLLMLRPSSSREFLSCLAFVIDEDTAVFFSVLRQLLQHLHDKFTEQDAEQPISTDPELQYCGQACLAFGIFCEATHLLSNSQYMVY